MAHCCGMLFPGEHCRRAFRGQVLRQYANRGFRRLRKAQRSYKDFVSQIAGRAPRDTKSSFCVERYSISGDRLLGDKAAAAFHRLELPDAPSSITLIRSAQTR